MQSLLAAEGFEGDIGVVGLRSLTVRVGEGGAIDSCIAEASLEGMNRVGDDSFEGDVRGGTVGASFEGGRMAREYVLGECDFDSPRSMTKCIP